MVNSLNISNHQQIFAVTNTRAGCATRLSAKLMTRKPVITSLSLPSYLQCVGWRLGCRDMPSQAQWQLSDHCAACGEFFGPSRHRQDAYSSFPSKLTKSRISSGIIVDCADVQFVESTVLPIERCPFWLRESTLTRRIAPALSPLQASGRNKTPRV